jgi:hypothetical protein
LPASTSPMARNSSGPCSTRTLQVCNRRGFRTAPVAAPRRRSAMRRNSAARSSRYFRERPWAAPTSCAA